MYATPTDIMKRYDVRRIGQLVRDDNTEATPTELQTDDILLTMLSDASGKINSAMLRGGRYTVADLEALTGDGSAFLLRLCCDLTFGYLHVRRGYNEEQITKLAPSYGLALQELEALKTGDIVFQDDDNIQAGVSHEVVLSKNVTLVSSALRLFGDLDIQHGRHP